MEKKIVKIKHIINYDFLDKVASLLGGIVSRKNDITYLAKVQAKRIKMSKGWMG